MLPPTVYLLKAFSDNYIWCLQQGQQLLVIDPGCAAPVEKFIADSGCTLHSILLTHAHADHSAGIEALYTAFPETLISAARNSPLQLPCERRQHLDTFQPWPGLTIQSIATPGHTQDHLCYYLPTLATAFTGDALFSAGCGRLFEGDAQDLLLSMQRCRALPEETQVYCAHEYTMKNLEFALSLWPENLDIQEYKQIVTKRLKWQQSSLPSTIRAEKQINPFFNWDNPAFYASLSEKTHHDLTEAVSYMHVVRALRDVFSPPCVP